MKANLLASAMSRLEEVGLSNTSLTNKQIKTLLTAINKEDSKLKKLDISHSDLDSAKPSLLAQALTKLEEVTLEYVFFGKKQINAIYNAIASGHSNLKKMKITYGFGDVEANLLVKVANNLEEFSIYSDIGEEKTGALIVAISEGKTKLKKLEIIDNMEMQHLDCLHPDLLAKAVGRLEEVNLASAGGWHHHQIEAILTQSLGGHTSLRKIKLNDLVNEVVWDENSMTEALKFYRDEQAEIDKMADVEEDTDIEGVEYVYEDAEEDVEVEEEEDGDEEDEEVETEDEEGELEDEEEEA